MTRKEVEMALKNLEALSALFKKIEYFVPIKEWRVIVSFLPTFEITEIEIKRAEKEIKRWAISDEKKMNEILWKIRNEIIEKNLKLFLHCFFLDLNIQKYSKKTFVRFVHAQVLKLVLMRK